MEMKQIPYDFTTRWGYHYFATEDGHIYSGHLKRTLREYTQKEIAAMYGVHEDSIGKIKRKQVWKSLTKDIDFH